MYTPECTVNITNDGCELKNTSLCGYCDHQVEDGYFINFTFTFDINKGNYWLFCYWYGIDNTYVQDNVITSSLQYDSENFLFFILQMFIHNQLGNVYLLYFNYIYIDQ